eukprot:jgi/Pico_ML_1/52107/g2868.t1
MARVPPLVDVRHLQRNLAKLAVVDASWHMPGSERDARKEFRRERVPKARFFDVDRVKDRRSDLPHMLPPPRAFHAAMKALDLVQPDQHLVVYDALGVSLHLGCGRWNLQIDRGTPSVFAQAGVDMDKKIIVGCGTGVTACVVALGLEVLGHQQVAVYDGSWTEWASRDDTPIAKGTA